MCLDKIWHHHNLGLSWLVTCVDLYRLSTRPCWNINLSKGLWYASKRAIIIVIWLSSRRVNWWLEFYWCRRVECIIVFIMIIMSNDPVWSMCFCWWHIRYRSLLAILRKKVGEPKEEIRNLYGSHMNSSNRWIHMYKFIYINSSVLWIHLIQIWVVLPITVTYSVALSRYSHGFYHFWSTSFFLH